MPSMILVGDALLLNLEGEKERLIGEEALEG